MFRLAHLSDVHLGPLPDVTYSQLLSKRMVGYVNWVRNRRFLLQDHVLTALVADIKAATPDHIAVTGDLVNLALDREIELARVWLDTLGQHDNVSVVPGNHDAYVPGAFDKICEHWAPYMCGDGANQTPSRSGFPYLRVRANVALIGVTTAYATAPFMANGFFRENQGERLAKMLAETKQRGLFRLIMMHHPPVREAVAAHKRLFGIGRFQEIVGEHGAELVLHGHSHEPTRFAIRGKDGTVPVIGVAAAGQGPGGEHPAAQYNMIEVLGEPGAWAATLTRRGLTNESATPVEIAREPLVGPGSEKFAITVGRKTEKSGR